MLREVLNGRLWVANAAEARDVPAVMNLEIRAIVDLAFSEPPATYPREIVSCRFPLLDGAENESAVLRAAILATSTLADGGVPTLVACSAGMSRSVAIAAAAISLVEQIAPEDALRHVAQAGPHDVSPALWAAVCDVLQKLR